MGFLTKAFLRGLAVILPIVVTIYILWWFLSGAESLLQKLFPLNPDYVPGGDQSERLYYHTGLGIAAGLVLTLVIGIALNNWLVRWIVGLGTSLLERVPLVKTIYVMLKDMVGFFFKDDTNDFNQVVMVRPVPEGPEMLGFITRSEWGGAPDGFGGEGKVGVYLPMSYQLGGFLVVVERDQVKPIEMEMEDALRIVLAAGVASPDAKEVV